MSGMPKRYCILCDFYSDSHAACYHPKAWRRGEDWPGGFGWLSPGDITLLNARGDCHWFENSGVAPLAVIDDDLKVQPIGLGFRFRLRKFFRRLWRRIGGEK